MRHSHATLLNTVATRNEILTVDDELRKQSNKRFSYPADEALIYASLNDNDQALTLLEGAYTDHFDAQVLRSPAFDSLRSQPRFQMLLRRMIAEVGNWESIALVIVDTAIRPRTQYVTGSMTPEPARGG